MSRFGLNRLKCLFLLVVTITLPLAVYSQDNEVVAMKGDGIYKYVTGGTLLVVGILMVTNTLFYLNIYGQKFLDSLGLDFWKTF